MLRFFFEGELDNNLTSCWITCIGSVPVYFLFLVALRGRVRLIHIYPFGNIVQATPFHRLSNEGSESKKPTLLRLLYSLTQV